MEDKNNFTQIVNNIFDYLFKSLDNINKDPKASIIFYYSGLELLFKARLIHEHWSFVLENLDDKSISYNCFLNGDFKSVTLELAARRIRNLFDDLEEGYEKNFEKLNTTRNKLIHFDSFNGKDKELSIEAISESWHYIHELLNKKWYKIFKDYKDKIETLNKAFKKYSIHFYTSKQKALIKKNESKYQNNPGYSLIELDNTPLTCNFCYCSHSKVKNLSLLNVVYDHENCSFSVSCDICDSKENVPLSWLYILNNNIIEEVENSYKNFFQNYKGAKYIKPNSEHDKLLLDKNNFINIHNWDLYGTNDVESTLVEINETTSKFVVHLTLDFDIESSFGSSAFYYLIINIDLIINKNKQQIEQLKFQDVYNNIVSHKIIIDVDSDGF